MTAAQGLLEAGRLLLDAGLPGRARAVFDRLLALDPSDREGQIGVATCLLQQRRPRQAMQILQTLDGDDPILWRLLALTALDAGAGDVARSAFERCQEITGEPPDPVSMAVAAYFELDTERCRSEVEAALAAHPDRPEALEWAAKLNSLGTRHAFLVDVARTHLRRGNIDDGLRLLEEAAAEGDTLEHRVLQGRALIAAARFDQALHHLQDSLERHPDDGQLRSALGAVLLLTGRAGEAVAELDRVLAGDGPPHDALVRRAQAAVVTDDSESAERWSAAARSDDPRDGEAWLVSAQAAALAGHDIDVRLMVDHALALNPADPQFWAEGGRLIRGRHPGLADHYARRAAALTGSDEVVSIEHELEPVEAEVAHLDGVIGGRPDFVDAYTDRVTIYGGLGLSERALTSQEAAWRRSPELGDDPEFHTSRGSLLAGLGALEGAETSFQQALQIAPEHEPARKALAAIESLRDSPGALD